LNEPANRKRIEELRADVKAFAAKFPMPY